MEKLGSLETFKKAIKKKRKKRSPRAKRVFDKMEAIIMKGEKPNISQLMREEGYSESSCRCQKVVRMNTWQEMLDQVPGDFVLQGFVDLASQQEDKRTRLNSLKEIAALKDLYPSKRMTINNGSNRTKYFEAEIIESPESQEEDTMEGGGEGL